MERWLKNEDAVQLSDAIVGVARMAPGTVAYLPMDLLPGRYIVYCLVPHPASHRPHVEMGMLREIRVD